MGHFSSATYAMARPERVDRLALLAPAGVVAGLAPSWWLSLLSTVVSRDEARIERFWFSHYVSTQPSALRLRFDRQFLAGNAGLRIATRDILPHKYGSKRLASLTMPTLLVFASNDVVHDGPKTAAKARRLLPSASVELLQECGHFMTFDRQAAVSILLTEFLSQTSAALANNAEPTTEDG